MPKEVFLDLLLLGYFVSKTFEIYKSVVAIDGLSETKLTKHSINEVIFSYKKFTVP